MDESWRVPIGLVVPTRRRYPEQTTELGGGLDAEDFLDVFGGPPPTFLRRQFSGGGGLTYTSFSSPTSSYGLHHSPSFYDEVFRQPPLTPPPQATKAGRRLPDFTVPSAVEVNCKSASEVCADDDGGLSSFMCKLRPIAVPARRGDWASPPSTGGSGGRSSAAPCTRLCFTHRRPVGCAAAVRVFDACVRLFRHHPSPETAADWRSCAAEEESLADGGNSPFSVISSVYDIPMATIRPVMPHEAASLGGFAAAAEEEEQAAGAEWWAAALDDAIAWAKEKSRG